MYYRYGLVIISLLGSLAIAQEPVLYEIAFPNAVHHEAEISVTFRDLPQGTLEARMSRSSPGRYAIHEFAKNVYRVKAVDSRGKALSISRPDPYQWDISGHDGTVKMTYTLFADRAGGTYSGIDETHAHLNIPATFMWARGQGDRPITVSFKAPKNSGWRVATQLEPTTDPFVFKSPNLYYFLDSPIELSAFDLREWDVSAKGQTQKIRIAMHHAGTAAELDVFAKMADAVVQEEAEVFGEYPRFDFGTYTFINDYLPYVSGDGMEHRNSTICASTSSLRSRATGLLGTVVHEFFHAWNVERIRPKTLEPFDFERANMSGELWFAEGFTSYYTNLIMRRARIISLDRYASRISGGLNFVINSPARDFFSAVGMSMQAPFVDAATAVDPTNRSNTFISYYTYGNVIGLGLDLTLRTQFGSSLDEYMRAVWAAHGRTEKPYTLMDLRRILGEVTGDPGFARMFFEKYIEGHEVVDYKALLSHAGLSLQLSNSGDAFLGFINLQYDEDGATVRSATRIGSPIYAAGVDRGDKILFLDGVALNSDEAFEKVRDAHKPGDRVSIKYEQRGRTKEAQVGFVAHPSLEVVLYEHIGREVTQAMRDFRESWLGRKSSFDLNQLQKRCPVCRRHYAFEREYCHFDGETLSLFE